MKRLMTLALGIFILSAVFLVSGCDLWNSIFGDPIVGTWTVTAVAVNGTPASIGTGSSQNSGTYTIKADNTLSLAGTSFGSAVTGSGTWSRNDASYTLTYSVSATSGSATESLIGTLSADKKTFSGAGDGTATPGGSYTKTFTLQKQ